ncbi:hypothetical protein N2W54_003505 [Lotmaria passim]
MSSKRAGSAGTLLQRRSEWLASLRASLPQFVESTESPLRNNSRAALFRDSKRHALDDAVQASLLVLPPKWKEEATTHLARTLHGVVELSVLRQSDYFLCSLLHPTYVRSSTMRCDSEAKRLKLQQQLRRTMCMPLELTMAGSKSLRLVREINSFIDTGAKSTFFYRSRQRDGDASSVASSSFQLDAPWPELQVADTRAFLASFRQSRLESLVLFDKAAFPPAPSAPLGGAAVPMEVSLAAFTALCGCIELVSGWDSLLLYLDRVAREQGNPHSGESVCRGTC